MTIYSKEIENLTFGKAFDTLCELEKREPGKYGMRLPSWKSDVVIRIQTPDKNSKMTAPYLYVQSRFGRVPWKETMIELFENTWSIVRFTVEDDDNYNDIEKIIDSDINNVEKKKCADPCTNNKLCNEFKEKINNKIDKNEAMPDKCSDKCLKRCLNECHAVRQRRQESMLINDACDAIKKKQQEPTLKRDVAIIVATNTGKYPDTLNQLIDAMLG